MANESDYNKSRTRLDKLLPEVYKSDTNTSIFENLFNRFFTNAETEKVAGYIGEGNPNAPVRRQIAEPSLHRQAFQLQPLTYSKIGSVEHITSWKDFLNELERLGVDIESLPLWGEAQQFNWVPPVDIDKVINYQDYYWVNPTNPTARPEYITIRSRCATATANLRFWERLIGTYGSSFPILDLLPTTDTIPSFVIQSIEANNTPGILDRVLVSGDITGDINPGQFIEIQSSPNNNGQYEVQGTVSYNSMNDTSEFFINPESFVVNESMVGIATPTRITRLVVSGDVSRLMTPGFIFFINSSINGSISNTFQTVKLSTFDASNDSTTVEILNTITSPIVSGEISLTENLELLQADVTCRCSGSAGWDTTPWDDNPSTPVWGGTPPGDLATFISTNSSATAPTTPTLGTVWYNTTADSFFQFDGTVWKNIYNNFSVILDSVTGSTLWDSIEGCGENSRIAAADQWIDTNFWVHKTDVQNFSTAKRAQLPILEYDWDLELNEWTYTEQLWKYRPTAFDAFTETTNKPNRFELEPIEDWDGSTSVMILDEKYGDLTDWFTPGTTFQTQTGSNVVTVAKSYYKMANVGDVWSTHIELTDPSQVLIIHNQTTPSTNRVLRPTQTSMGNPWKNYHDHWLYVGEAITKPVNHQASNPFVLPSPTDVVVPPAIPGNPSEIVKQYSQTYILGSTVSNTFLLSTATPTNTRPLSQMAIIDGNNIRVYINNVRQYGTYSEISNPVILPADIVTGAIETVEYVGGVTLDASVVLNQFDEIRIEVGEAATSEFGLATVPVRTIEDNVLFQIDGPVTTSLTSYRKAEQVKTTSNQYPLFDIYNVDGTSAYRANPIFGYQTSSSSEANLAVSQRLVIDDGNVTFNQFILDGDDEQLFAYRDYSNEQYTYWFDERTQTVNFWDGFTWSDTISSGPFFGKAIVSPSEPSSFYTNIDGQYWYDTTTDELKVRVLATPEWITLPSLSSVSDHTIQTIWKAGPSPVQYVPSKVDWMKRTLEEYTTEQTLFVDGTVAEILATDVTATPASAAASAQQSWLDSQKNIHSTSGAWIGDWEIPDQLYFNNQHENRKLLTSQEILTHFSTIIAAQPQLPGYSGDKSTMFHLIPSSDVDYGLGGTIKEFNDGFDTLISSLFVNNVTPISLNDFAHDQYESLLNSLVESFRRNVIEYVTDTTTTSCADLAQTAYTDVLNSHNQNDKLTFVYSDSTTFTDNINTPDTGVRNWIATLPYIGISHGTTPHKSIDNSRGITEVIHHDGHRKEYTLGSSTIENVIRQITSLPDERTRFPSPSDDPIDTFGRIDITTPPNTYLEFGNSFNTSIVNREGVVWYTVQGTERTLYKYVVAESGTTEPSVSLPDGTLWFDTASSQEVLRIKSGTSWNVVPGLSLGDGRLHNGTDPLDITTSSISAWLPVNIDEILSDVILGFETELYNNIPVTKKLRYDITAPSTVNPAQSAIYNEQAFLNFVREQDIITPYVNVDYSLSDPFSWNYKHSSTPLYPASINTGLETGGDWRDLYTKLYNTPYPHLEPWMLQGYTTKPTWWETEYGNDMPEVYGSRRWKYLHGITITNVDPITNSFGLLGDFTSHFQPADSFIVDDSINNSGSFVVVSSSYDSILNTTTIITATNITSGVLEGRIKKQVGMWENIRTGVIPPAREYPNGLISVTGSPATDLFAPSIPTYNYFSVNIDNIPVSDNNGTTNYASDDILPPYWNHTEQYGLLPDTFNQNIRSVFSTFTSDIVSPGSNYSFGDVGPLEWLWKTSSRYGYDQMSVSYRIDPMRYTAHTFGFDYHIVGDLQIDQRTNNVPSHTRTIFHGEVLNDQVFKSSGTNQWYANYNRFNGFDTSFSDFRTLWTQWTSPIMYQFSSFVDTPSLQVGHRILKTSEFDYDVTAKISRGTSDFWLDAFDVTLVRIPPHTVRYNNEKDWELEINTNLPTGRTIQYYDVHNYQFHADSTTNTCTMYKYALVEANAINNTVTVSGDMTDILRSGIQFNISSSLTADGTYTIETSVFNSVSNETIITVVESITSSVTVGWITADYRKLPWQTGDLVYLSTDETIPAPLDILKQYFIIRLSDNTFQIANTLADAEAGSPIDLLHSGRRNSYVGQLENTFVASSGAVTNTTWRQYKTDKSNVLTLTTPHDIKGIQTLIDIVSGYEEYSNEQGWVINEDKNLFDFSDTSRMISWRLELERFIDFAYRTQTIRNQVSDTYPVTAIDTSTNVWQFAESNTTFITGDAVEVTTTQNVFPTPFVRGIRYYIIRDSFTDFRLAVSKQDAENGIEIDVTSIAGIGPMAIIAASQTRESNPHHEINPFRHGVWFRPEFGIVSNVIEGPSSDVRTTHLMFDQYGRALTEDNMRVYRQDKITQISIETGLENDISPVALSLNPYDFIHFGGMHIFVDVYEHVLKFNNYTTEDALLYDSFIGLNVTKYELLFNRQIDFTQRPNVGGHYISTFFNQGVELNRNFEASVNDLRQAYDTFTVLESNPMMKQSRDSLGYEGQREYLDNLNLNQKSQFLFWRGQIQAKGSINAISAFVNSRRFIDAKVDEFWAVKIAEYGSATEKEYPEMLITPVDTRSNDIRFQFVSTDSGGAYVPSIIDGFTPITAEDQTRWYNQPDQISVLRDNESVMYFKLTPIAKLTQAEITTPSAIIKHNFASDAEEITFRWMPDGTEYTAQSADIVGTTVSTNISYVPFTGNISVFVDGVELSASDFIETDNVVASYEGNEITIPSLVGGESVHIIWKIGTMVENTHYTRINSNIIQISHPPLVPGIGVITDFVLWGLQFDNSSQSPASLVDKKSRTVLSPIQYWDPARQHQSKKAIQVVDLETSSDPSFPRYSKNDTTTRLDFWNSEEVGTVWFDTSTLDYLPYYDSHAIPDSEDRLRSWGHLSEYSDINLYEWVESDVHPSEYNTIAEKENGDTSIDESIRKSGTVKSSIISRSRKHVTSPTLAASPTFTINHPFVDGDIVRVGGESIPAPLESGMEYTIVNSVPGVSFELSGVTVTETGSVTVSDFSFPTTWVTESTIIEKFDSVDAVVAGLNSTFATSQFAIGDTVEVYKNGVLYTTSTFTTNIIISIPTSDLTVSDYIAVLKPAHIMTDEDTAFDPDVTDNGDTHVHYQISYDYSSVETFDDLNETKLTYYFWVRNKTTRLGNNTISINAASTQLATIPDPYIFFQHALPAVGDLPARNTCAIIRGLRGSVTEENRMVVRFTRDFALRDELRSNISDDLKHNLHEEWQMFRKDQLSHIRRDMWNKITESMIGYLITSPNTRVPSFERELYDDKYDTSTRYGIGPDQAFTDGATALNTIQTYLNSPDNDFRPVNISTFLTEESFSTPENIIATMNGIYNQFTFEHVNNMFFSVLHDAFSVQDQYKDIFKTSMIALHGVRPFQVGGLFDD